MAQGNFLAWESKTLLYGSHLFLGAPGWLLCLGGRDLQQILSLCLPLHAVLYKNAKATNAHPPGTSDVVHVPVLVSLQAMESH